MDTTIAKTTASGLEGVVVADTRLSEVDGERGRLVVAGHDIEALTGSGFIQRYRDLKHEVELIGMQPSQFITQVNNAYHRFQEHRGLDSFQPMDDKSMKYVLDFMAESIKEVAKEVSKNTAKSLIR